MPHSPAGQALDRRPPTGFRFVRTCRLYRPSIRISMRKWNYLQFSLHPRHLESASAIIAEMGTRGIHEQPLKSGEVLLRAYFDPSSDIGRVPRRFPVPVSGISRPGCRLRDRNRGRKGLA